MNQPNNYGFGEEAVLLRDHARRFFAEKLPVDQLHALLADDPTPDQGPACRWREDLWQDMVELGWTALAVPESAGGIGMPWVAVASLLEEAGRAAFPSPLLTTQCCSAVLGACGEGGYGALGEIADGEAATLVLMDAAGGPMPGAVVASNGELEGEAFYVQEPGKCSRLLVLASEEGRAAWYWVHRDADGVELTPDAIVDLSRDQGRVRFSAARGERIEADGDAAWATAQPIIWMLHAADMVGAAEWQLQTTVDYARQRQQFERPLGFFQAIKHDLVNVMLKIDESRSLLYSAACAVDHEPERLRLLSHMAKASASDTAAFASGRSVQCHGGIGFTWEAFLHLYFKRQKHSQLLWGDSAWHRAQLAVLVIDQVA